MRGARTRHDYTLVQETELGRPGGQDVPGADFALSILMVTATVYPIQAAGEI